MSKKKIHVINSSSENDKHTKYDCDYLDCDDHFHMTKCLRLRVWSDCLFDEFKKRGFKCPFAALYLDTSCTNCKDNTRKCKKHKDPDVLEKIIRKDFKKQVKSGKVSDDLLRSTYLVLKSQMLEVKLNYINENISEMKEWIHEDRANKPSNKPQEI